LLPIAEQLGEKDAAAECERRLKTALENFLTVRAPDGREKKSALFAYEPNWGTLIGYPASFGSDQELNDHHFHYGYFLHAAAELARRDPAWTQRWLPMVRLLVRDIASADRRDPLFPYLRCFDIYAGHSWASGHGRFGDGNNQESSSESINAWYSLLMLAEVIGDQDLRDQAAWLLATEVSAIEDYWFNVHGDLFPRSYPASVVTMVWGGKGANATWFDANPQSIHGINFLPITGGSLYLGRHPAYARKNHTALLGELADFRLERKKGAVAPQRAARPLGGRAVDAAGDLRCGGGQGQLGEAPTQLQARGRQQLHANRTLAPGLRGLRHARCVRDRRYALCGGVHQERQA